MTYDILITIYNSLVLPHLDYCSPVWGCRGKGLSDIKIQKPQNRTARIITNTGDDVRSITNLENLGWDNLEQRRERQLAITMFNSLNQLALDGISY